MFVMAGLDPAIHVFNRNKQDVDARDKRGHDGDGFARVYDGKHTRVCP